MNDFLLNVDEIMIIFADFFFIVETLYTRDVTMIAIVFDFHRYGQYHQ